MTNLDDFDRSLASFLGDGPSIAPEAPVIAAMAHARTTPRRRDPFAALRRDVMARPSAVWGSRATLVFAAVALALASVGIALVGSRQNDSTTPQPSATPSAVPSAATRSVTTPISVLVASGRLIELDVVDPDRVLAGAVSVQPPEGISVDPTRPEISRDPANPAVLTVLWSGLTCQTRGTLLVDATLHRVTVAMDDCTGDSVGGDRIVRLTFAEPLDDATWTAVLAPLEPSNGPDQSASPSAGTASIPVELEPGTAAPNGSTVDIVDLSGHLTGASVNAADRQTAVDSLTVTNVDEHTLRIVWPGSPCDTVHRLTIAPDFGITIDRPRCFGDAMLVIRAVRIDFDEPVDAAVVDTGLFDGRPDSGLPSWTVTGIASGGGRFDLAIVDESGSVERAETIGDTTGATDPGAHAARVDQIGPAILRFTWSGPTCATSATLVVHDSGTVWELQTVDCSTNIVAVIRSVDITFAAPRAAGDISVSSSSPTP